MEDENKFKYLRGFLESGCNDSQEDEIYLDDQQLEDLVIIAMKEFNHLQNVGFNFQRCDHNPREKAFHDEWFDENEPRPGLNGGHGILSALIERKEINHILTPVERNIVATVIQWLGSNIGMSFLERALKRCGYQITEIENFKS